MNKLHGVSKEQYNAWKNADEEHYRCNGINKNGKRCRNYDQIKFRSSMCDGQSPKNFDPNEKFYCNIHKDQEGDK